MERLPCGFFCPYCSDRPERANLLGSHLPEEGRATLGLLVCPGCSRKWGFTLVGERHEAFPGYQAQVEELLGPPPDPRP